MEFKHLEELDTYDTWSTLKHLRSTWEVLEHLGQLGISKFGHLKSLEALGAHKGHLSTWDT